MRTPASIAGHPIHPMLVPLPIGLWLFSVFCDLAFAFGSGDATWKTVALYTAIGGIVGALAAAIFGLVDLLSLQPPVRGTAIKHMTINLVVVALFAASVWLRLGATTAAGRFDLPVLLSIVAILLLVVSGWLGGKMVYEGGVGVQSAGDGPRG